MIQEIIVKKYMWSGVLDHISLIVKYESDRVFTRSYHDIREIPYTFRDFLESAEIEDVKEIIPEHTPYSILQTTYRRVRINETMRDMQEQEGWM